MSDTAAITPAAAAPPPVHTAWKDPSGFGFRDIIDIVNPLQHLPVISSIYRWLTGDRPGDAAKIAGDALYGGPIGVAFGLLGAAAEDAQGRDLGEHVLAVLFDSSGKTAVAATATPPPAAAAALPPPTSAAVAAPAALPDHPPMPLFGGIALPTGPTAQSAATPNAAARDLRAYNATLQRQLTAGARPGIATTAPVPLVLPAGTLPPPRVSGLPAPAAAAVNPAQTPDTPVDIPQKMLDGLDKYLRLEQERKRDATQPSAPSVDLSL